MSEQYKYEPVFGPQELFDGAPDDVDMIGHSGGHYKNTPNGILYCGGCTFTADELRNTGFIAMRRIIKVPVWKKADQLAGKLPEVGCRVSFCHKLNTNWRTGEIKYIDDQVAVIKTDDIDRPFVYEVDRVEFKPIESPEEKAQRLRDEWCSECTSKYYPRGHKGFPEMIYDALLSGELPMPKKGGE